MYSSCPNKKARIDSSPIANTHFKKLTITGDNHKSGIFGVSIEYGDDGIVWMTYSRVELPKYVEPHVARSNDHGEIGNTSLLLTSRPMEYLII